MRVGEGPGARVYALIGDGRREIRTLRAAAEKYDHKKLIKVPQTPTAGTGPASVVKRLAILLQEVEVDNYVVLMDKEHVRGKEELLEKLRDHAINVLGLEVEGDCWGLKVERAGRRAVVHVVLLGLTKCIEENYAALIKLMHGEDVRGSKEEVNRWLRERGLEDWQLVRSAPREVFERAFPQLSKALREISDP